MTSGSDTTHPLQLLSVRAVACQRGRLSPLWDDTNQGEVVTVVVVSCSCERKGKLEICFL